MGSLHNFTYGPITPVLAYGLSFLGSLLGLVATGRARAASTTGQRARWLVLAAWAIGGTGIWVMHFMAMIGFTVSGTVIKYDIPTTVASWLTAVIVVGFGLFAVGYGRPSLAKLLIGGPLTGAGVAAMHYTGMAAMRADGSIGYDTNLVIASVAIAVVAATVALWFTLVVRGAAATIAAAAIMGVAVTGMHYTGMIAMRFHMQGSASSLRGVDPLTFLVPIILFVILVAAALAYALLAVPSQRDRDFQDSLPTRLTDKPELSAVPPSSSFIPRSQRSRGI
jgi:NO-binding membrane sensor protein with MHYT domain